MQLNCSIFEPCWHLDCQHCAPAGSIPSNMRFARNALSEIFKAKRHAYTGCWPYQSFPRDPAAPENMHNLRRDPLARLTEHQRRYDFQRYNKW